MNFRLPFRAVAASLLCLGVGSWGAAVMYRAFIRANLRRALRDLSQGRHEVLLRRCSPSIEHTFPGAHPLGGTRHSSGAVRRWFERLYHLFPQLSFEVHDVVVRGWPWDIRAMIEWTDRATPRDGVPYVNEGTHWLHLRWGRIVRLRAYLDTAKVEEVCSRLAARGVAEATAPPIED